MSLPLRSVATMAVSISIARPLATALASLHDQTQHPPIRDGDEVFHAGFVFIPDLEPLGPEALEHPRHRDSRIRPNHESDSCPKRSRDRKAERGRAGLPKAPRVSHPRRTTSSRFSCDIVRPVSPLPASLVIPPVRGSLHRSRPRGRACRLPGVGLRRVQGDRAPAQGPARAGRSAAPRSPGRPSARYTLTPMRSATRSRSGTPGLAACPAAGCRRTCASAARGVERRRRSLDLAALEAADPDVILGAKEARARSTTSSGRSRRRS